MGTMYSQHGNNHGTLPCLAITLPYFAITLGYLKITLPY